MLPCALNQPFTRPHDDVVRLEACRENRGAQTWNFSGAGRAEIDEPQRIGGAVLISVPKKREEADRRTTIKCGSEVVFPKGESNERLAQPG